MYQVIFWDKDEKVVAVKQDFSSYEQLQEYLYGVEAPQDAVEMTWSDDWRSETITLSRE